MKANLASLNIARRAFQGEWARHQPYKQINGFWIFKKDGHEIKLNPPQLRYIRLSITHSAIVAGLDSVLHQIQMGFETLKKDFGVNTENWVGNVEVSEFYVLPNADIWETKIYGQMIDIEKTIHNLDFNDKVQDIIND